MSSSSSPFDKVNIDSKFKTICSSHNLIRIDEDIIALTNLKDINLFNWRSQTVVTRLSIQSGETILFLRFLPSKSLLMAITDTFNLEIFDTQSADLIHAIQLNSKSLYATCCDIFDSDQQSLLAVGTSHSNIVILDLDSHKIITNLKSLSASSVKCVKFIDDSTLVFSDQYCAARLVNFRHNKVLAEINSHADVIVAFHIFEFPSGNENRSAEIVDKQIEKYICCISRDNTMSLWGRETNNKCSSDDSWHLKKLYPLYVAIDSIAAHLPFPGTKICVNNPNVQQLYCVGQNQKKIYEMQLDSTLKLDFHEAFATADENKWSVEIGALLSVDSDSLLVLCGNSRLYEMSRHNQEGRIGEKLACRCTMIPLAPQIVSNIEILQFKQEKSNKLLSGDGNDLQESTWLAFFQADSHLLLHHIQSDTTLSALVSFTSPLQNRSDSTDQDVDSDLTLEFSITHIYFDSVLGLMHCFSSHGWHYVFKLKFDKSMDSELKASKNDLKMRLLAKERLHEAQLGIPSSIECFAASLDQKELGILAENISNGPAIPKASYCKRYATADRSGILQIYAPISSDRKSSSGCFKTHAVIKAHGKPITSLCFSTDENASLIMTGSRDKSIKIWQSDSLVEQATLLGHKRAINHLLYLPNRTLLSASIDGVIKQWSIDDYSCQRSFTMPHTLQQSAATNITMLYPVDLHEFLACSATGHIIKFSYKKMTSKIISRLPLKNSTEDNYDKKPDITDNEVPEKIIYTIGNNVIQRCATLAYGRAKVDLPLFMASDSNIFEVKDCTDEINESLKTETIENIQKQQLGLNLMASSKYIDAFLTLLQTQSSPLLLECLIGIANTGDFEALASKLPEEELGFIFEQLQIWTKQLKSRAIAHQLLTAILTKIPDEVLIRQLGLEKNPNNKTTIANISILQNLSFSTLKYRQYLENLKMHMHLINFFRRAGSRLHSEVKTTNSDSKPLPDAQSSELVNKRQNSDEMIRLAKKSKLRKNQDKAVDIGQFLIQTQNV